MSDGRRRVLTPSLGAPAGAARKASSTSLSSLSLTSKPLKARVDPSAFAPRVPVPVPAALVRSPTLASPSPAPAPARPRIAASAGSAPSTPQTGAFVRASPSPASSSRAPSPVRPSGALAASRPRLGEGASPRATFGAAGAGAGAGRTDELAPGVSKRSTNRTASPRASPALASPHSPSPFHDLESNGFKQPVRKATVVGYGPAHGTAHDGLGLLPPAALTVPPSPTLSSLSLASQRSLSPRPLATSPTFSDLPPPRARLTRPPAVASNPVPPRHARSHSSASSVASSTLLVSDDGYGSASRSVVGKALLQSPPLSSPPAEPPTRRESSDDILAKDAKFERRVLDLEIRNASLLTVNTSLELLKLRQSIEIRDLRRRLRESRSLAPLSRAELPVEGLDSSSDDDDDDDEDEGEEAVWEDVLAADEKFAAAANVLEALVRRARDAIAFHPSREGRVLHQAELLLDDESTSEAPSPAPASVAGDDVDSSD